MLQLALLMPIPGVKRLGDLALLALLIGGVYKATACFPTLRTQECQGFQSSQLSWGVSSCCKVLRCGSDHCHAPAPGLLDAPMRVDLIPPAVRARKRVRRDMPCMAASRSTSAAGRGPSAKARVRNAWAARVFAPSLGRGSARAFTWAGKTGLRQATVRPAGGEVPACAGTTGEEGRMKGMAGRRRSWRGEAGRGSGVRRVPRRRS